MRNRITVFLMLLVTLLCVLTLLIITNLSGYQKFMGELHGATLEVARGLWIALQVLFWVLLAFGAALAVLYVRDRSRVQVIAPGKRGAVQALVLADGRVEHLGGAMQGDAMQQLAMLERAMKLRTKIMQESATPQLGPGSPSDAPSDSSTQENIGEVVKYEDVEDDIPVDMSLLGIHPDDGSLELIDWEKLKMLWVVGSSSSGKTNTVMGKIREAVKRLAKLLVVDQHAHKEDSLARKLAPYEPAYLRPLAVSDREVLAQLAYFKAEFERRVAGGSCEQKIVLICDEMNRMARNDTLKKALQEIVAICGEESRGFGMYGWFISQKCAHLKWLRDSAITVIVHRLTRFEEAMLACNEDRAAARRLLLFRVGRTYAYGVDIEEPMELQQALYPTPGIVDATPLPHRFQPISLYSEAEASQEAGGSSNEAKSTDADLSAVKTLREIGKRLKNGESPTDIVKSFGLPYGRATQEMMEAVRFVEAELNR